MTKQDFIKQVAERFARIMRNAGMEFDKGLEAYSLNYAKECAEYCQEHLPKDSWEMLFRWHCGEQESLFITTQEELDLLNED